MKHTLLTLALLFTILISAQAQSWAPFYPNDTAYYLDAQSKMYGLTALDSVIGVGVINYKVFRTVEYGSNCSSGNDNISTNKPTWAGPEVHKVNNGNFYFFQ
ncbi:hypothetical protein BH09BAC1_BH09BAC1_06800 [soil metagenome]